MTAAIIGLAAGVVCDFAVTLENRVFASTLWNPNGADGLLRGNPAFLGKQFVAAVVCSGWAFVFTYAMLWPINLITPVKVDEAAEERGLDVHLHGEEAYPLGV